MLIATAIISGLGLGSMYGLLALGFHVTHAVSRTVNFAQGSTMMLGAVLCFTFWVTLKWPLPLAVIVGLAGCALWGVIVERVAVRPFVARGSNSWLIATVALGIVLDNVVLFTFGKDPRGMPPGILTTGAISIAGVRVQYLQALIPVIGLLLAAALQILFANSRHGKALLAVVQNRDAARLMGIRVERVIEFAFALSGLLAGVAGILVAPLFTISSTMGTLFGIKAFAVAILGGIESAWGVVLAGLIYGVAEALITALARLDLHADRHLRAGHPRARVAAERPVRPRPVEESMSWQRAAAAAIVIAAVCFLIVRGNNYQVFIIVTVGLTAIVGIGLNVLLGLNGQISLGHVAFYAIGAYAVGILTTDYDWSFWPALVVAGIVAGLAGVLLAIPALRVRGPYLAMVTIAFGFVVEQGAAEWQGLDRRLERLVRHSGAERARP